MRRRLGICFILRLGEIWAFFTTNSLFTAVVRFGNVGANFLAKIKAQKDDFEIKFEKVSK